MHAPYNLLKFESVELHLRFGHHMSIRKLCLQFQCRGMAERNALEPVHQKSKDRRVLYLKEQMPVLSVRHFAGIMVF